MIRVVKAEPYMDGKTNMMVALNSLDVKPTKGVAMGSMCIEADTGSIFLYDEDTHTWNKVSGGSSAGAIVGTAKVGTAKI